MADFTLGATRVRTSFKRARALAVGACGALLAFGAASAAAVAAAFLAHTGGQARLRVNGFGYTLDCFEVTSRVYFRNVHAERISRRTSARGKARDAQPKSNGSGTFSSPEPVFQHVSIHLFSVSASVN